MNLRLLDPTSILAAGMDFAFPPPSLRRAPSPTGEFLLGHLRQVRERPLDFMLECLRTKGDVVRLRFGHRTVHLLFHPDHLEHVLVRNRSNYTKRARGYSKLRRMLGNGLVTSEGETWQRNRRLAAPAFSPNRIAGFARTMTRAAQDAAERWEKIADTRQAVDVSAEMMRLTMRLVGETLLGSPEKWDSKLIGRALAVALEDVSTRINSVFDVPDPIPTPRNMRFQWAMRTLDKAVLGMIADRRRDLARPGTVEPTDLLTMLMLARDEGTGEGMTDQQLRDEVMTIFLAGHETSANALSWTWFLLSRHADSARKLRAELDWVLRGRAPTFEDLPKLEYTRMVIQESMRLYPPVWGIIRSVERADVIGGYEIPAGGDVVLGVYGTHRHPAFWENPEGFDPERFTSQRLQSRHKLAWLPFSGGPRACIGNHFAMMELTLATATIAQRFRLDLLPGREVVPEPVVTLRPKKGLWMTVHRW